MNHVKAIIDTPQKNSSLLYALNYYCIDPVIYLEVNDKKIGWFPSTEYENAKKKSSLDIVYNLSDAIKEINSKESTPCLKSSILINYFFRNNISNVTVNETFPVIDADNLRKAGIKLIPERDPFFKSRVSKTVDEIDKIRENTRLNCLVMQEIKDIIAESSITNDKKLKYKNEILTSEFIQEYLIKSFIEKSLISENSIVAIGNQGCFPHEYGSGPVYANTSIIVDIFPRNRNNYYFTDMTRTFCKGKAPDELKKLYNTVAECQKLGLEKIHARANGKTIHNDLQNFFISQGYKTGIINGILQGFFHGTGHGVGLDCHEAPYISLNGSELPENSIVTVEPGLYYMDLGAVRIEDIVLVTKEGCENFVNFDKILEIE